MDEIKYRRTDIHTNRLHVNKKLLLYKVHYAFYHGGGACIILFLPVYLKEFGVSPGVSGMIYTILPFIGILSQTLGTALVDKFSKQRAVLIISIAVMILLVFSINFIPSIPRSVRKPSFQPNCTSSHLHFQLCDINTSNKNLSHDSQLHCLSTCILSHGNRNSDICLQRFGSSNDIIDEEERRNSSFTLADFVIESKPNFCVNYHLINSSVEEISQCYSMVCNNLNISSCMNECLPIEEVIPNLYSTYQFWWLALAIILKGITDEMITSVGDAVMYNFLGESKEKYGYQRVWGTVSHGVMNLISGFLLYRATDPDGKTHYSIGFYLFLSLMLIDCLNGFFLDIVPQERSKTILKKTWGNIKNFRGFVFFTAMFCNGMLSAIMDSFLFWYIEDLGGSKLLMGTVTVIQCFCGEMLFMLLSGIIIKKIGHFNALTVTLSAYGLRYVLYSLITDPWYILPIEILHGFGFGLFWPAATSYASTLATAGITTTIQGLMSALNSGAGAGIGSLLGGMVYQTLGGRLTFRIFGVVGFFCAILHAVASYWIYRSLEKERKEKQLESSGKLEEEEEMMEMPTS